MTPASLTVVIPAYNEAQVIGSVVRKVNAALHHEGVADFTILVIDDGSTDGTQDEVLACREDSIPVHVVRHARNRGYGWTLRSGFVRATAPVIWLLDGDGQFDPADVHLLFDRYRDGAMVCGYRAKRADPWQRKLASFAFFTCVRLVFGPMGVRDVDCAFKLIPSDAVLSLTTTGAMISTEMILTARKHHHRIIEVGVPHYPRRTGNPTGMRPRVVLRAFRELFMLRSRPPQ